jgi:PhnB protein
MPLNMNPYLNFDGNCAEAMRFYGGVFGNEPRIMRFSDAPMPATPGTENRVMHASMRVGETMLMASDTMPGSPLTKGSNVYLSISFVDAGEQTRIFDALAKGGKVEMPLSDQFFGRFGMLSDQFGVKWMVILEPQKK